MSRAAKKNQQHGSLSADALSFGRQSKGYRKHYAASWKYADVVSAGNWCGTSGGERIGIAGAVGLDRLGESRASDGVASDVVLVE